MNGGKITFAGPPVDEVTPEDIAEALEMFLYEYLYPPFCGPYREGDNSHLGLAWAIHELRGEHRDREIAYSWMQEDRLVR